MNRLISFCVGARRQLPALAACFVMALALTATAAYADPPTYTIPDLIPNYATVLTTIAATLVTAVVAAFGFFLGWKVLKVVSRLIGRVVTGRNV